MRIFTFKKDQPGKNGECTKGVQGQTGGRKTKEIFQSSRSEMMSTKIRWWLQKLEMKEMN